MADFDLNRFLEINDAAPGGTPAPVRPAPPSAAATAQKISDINVGHGAPGGMASEVFGAQNAAIQDLITALTSAFDQIGATGGGGLSARSKALAAINRRELKHQRKTGLRDIRQQRKAGLQAAVNNALERGIFDSGIKKKNRALVNRESDEAASDLKAKIAFALERLDAQKLSGGSGLSSGSGFAIDEEVFKVFASGIFGENPRINYPTIPSSGPSVAGTDPADIKFLGGAS